MGRVDIVDNNRNKRHTIRRRNSKRIFSCLAWISCIQAVDMESVRGKNASSPLGELAVMTEFRPTQYIRSVLIRDL